VQAVKETNKKKVNDECDTTIKSFEVANETRPLNYSCNPSG
jgi:hypothetical protein